MQIQIMGVLKILLVRNEWGAEVLDEGGIISTMSNFMCISTIWFHKGRYYIVFDNVGATLSRLCLVENLGYNQFTFFFIFIVTQMVLMHYPIRFFWLFLLPIVSVKHKYLLVAFNFCFQKNWPSLTSFMPSSLAPINLTMHLSSFPCSCGVRFGWSMKEMSNQTVLAHSCMWLVSFMKELSTCIMDHIRSLQFFILISRSSKTYKLQLHMFFFNGDN